MKLSEVANGEQLRDFMSQPSEALVEFMGGLQGDVLVLGASGKMGPELVEMIVRADRQAGTKRRVIGASTFSGESQEARRRFAELGVDTCRGDLADTGFLKSLPDAPYVIYMAGVKFGSSGDWRKTFHLNCIMPYLVGERFSRSSIVVFSSGNPYPDSDPGRGGCRETDALEPHGVYGWAIVAREGAFETTAMKSERQKLCFFRLFYAQHLAYGVLLDLARMVWSGEGISLTVPAVNLVSQRDANDVAIRALGHCTNTPFVLNVAGPIAYVRDIAQKFGQIMGKAPVILDKETETTSLGNDDRCVSIFGPHRDAVDEMIAAVANWVMRGGEDWGKPTLFGKVNHQY